jgi:hypothetical protein
VRHTRTSLLPALFALWLGLVQAVGAVHAYSHSATIADPCVPAQTQDDPEQDGEAGGWLCEQCHAFSALDHSPASAGYFWKAAATASRPSAGYLSRTYAASIPAPKSRGPPNFS